MNVEDIRIKKSILHILDNVSDIPVYSDIEHPMDSEIGDFISIHLKKILKNTSIKRAKFLGEENYVAQKCFEMSSLEGDFVGASISVAEKLYGIMKEHTEIDPADLLVCLVDMDGEDHILIMKINYRNSFIHQVNYQENNKVNMIIKQRTALPTSSQRVEEAAIISLSDFDIKVLEKTVEIDGDKRLYFSEDFLNCDTSTSDKDVIKEFEKANKDFSKMYFDEEFSNVADIKTAISDTIKETGEIDIKEVAQKAFEESPQMQKIYVEHMAENEIEEVLNIEDIDKVEKKYEKQKIKTDNGIEIKLPREYYKDKDLVEFINNLDGTVSILIKNIGNLIDK